MLTRLVILGGATGLQEVVELIADINAEVPRYEIIGALDDSAALHGKKVDGVPVLGPLAKAKSMESDVKFVFAIGSYANRLKRVDVFDSIGLARERFVTLIHPSAKVYGSASVGKGCILYNNALVMAGSKLGDFIVVFGNSVIAPNCRLDDFALIGSLVFIGAGAHIGSVAFLASSSAVMEKIKIGPGAMVGLASAALRDVPPGVTVMGNPARSIDSAEVPQRLTEGWAKNV